MNDSEFLNAYVQRISRQRGIRFTKSQPYQKNDCALGREQELVIGPKAHRIQEV